MHSALTASLWMGFAGIGSSVVGQAHLLVRIRLAGGGFSTLARALVVRRTAVVTIVAIDFAAGLILAAAAVLTGITQPSQLITFVNKSPALGWALLGAVGPLLSDRLFSGAIVRGRFDPDYARTHKDNPEDAAGVSGEGARIRDDAWRLRSEQLKSIELAVWVLVQGKLSLESARLLRAANELAIDDKVRLFQLVPLTRKFEQLEGDRFTPTLREALCRLDDFDATGASAVDLVLALVEELISAEIWEPLEVIANGNVTSKG